MLALGLLAGCATTKVEEFERIANFDELLEPLERLPPLDSVAVGGNMSCGLGPSGVVCWGPLVEALTVDGSPGPVALPLHSRWTTLALDFLGLSVCGLDVEGRISCFVLSREGPGRRLEGSFHAAEIILPLPLAQAITGGAPSGCLATRKRGRVTCWSDQVYAFYGGYGCRAVQERELSLYGEERLAELGLGAGLGWSWSIAELEDVVELASSPFMQCARTRTGSVACWGGTTNQCGGASARVAIDDAVALQVGVGIACAATARGTWSCWDRELRPEPLPALPSPNARVVIEPGSAISFAGSRVWVMADPRDREEMPQVQSPEPEHHGTWRLVRDDLTITDGASGFGALLIDDRGGWWSNEGFELRASTMREWGLLEVFECEDASDSPSCIIER